MMTNELPPIVRIVGYITAGTVLLAGIVILTGHILPSYVPSNYRLITGFVMVLYGSYRIAMIRMKQRNEKRLEDEN